MKYAGLEVEAVKKEKARQKEFENELARVVDDFERQSLGFVKGLEDKALKNKLDKERLARKAELNRAVMSKVARVSSPHVSKGSSGVSSPHLSQDSSDGVSDTIAVGSRVITSFGNIGTIEKMDKEVAEVLVGGMRLREKISDLRLADIQESKAKKAETRPVGSVPLSRNVDGRDIPAELNLIGKTTADAEYELDRFIDEAYMSSLPRIRIIHGFGTGALKNYVHHFLKNHELIERFEFAPSSQGGNGATIADLKQ